MPFEDCYLTKLHVVFILKTKTASTIGSSPCPYMLWLPKSYPLLEAILFIDTLHDCVKHILKSNMEDAKYTTYAQGLWGQETMVECLEWCHKKVHHAPNEVLVLLSCPLVRKLYDFLLSLPSLQSTCHLCKHISQPVYINDWLLLTWIIYLGAVVELLVQFLECATYEYTLTHT